jgi:hypothetical protein
MYPQLFVHTPHIVTIVICHLLRIHNSDLPLLLLLIVTSAWILRDGSMTHNNRADPSRSAGGALLSELQVRSLGRQPSTVRHLQRHCLLPDGPLPLGHRSRGLWWCRARLQRN